MKVETIERNIQRSSNFNERAMGLAAGSESFVFNVLRKDLYSDPIGSLIREYTANAMDEHRKHNKTDVPILIKVPSIFSPELHIRDFANGLDEEQVFNFFGNYGASDKRDSNVAVGFFGLGCKSAFAYTDSYVVKSYKNGKVLTFNVYIDETEIGRVAKISEEKTDEPNGVLIVVPAKSSDVNTFANKVITAATYFKTKPKIEGLSYEPNLEKKPVLIEGKDWQFFGSGTPIAIMGEIAYPIDVSKMGMLDDWQTQLLRSELHIFTNIGEVQVTASREALQMSPKTIQAIKNRLIDVKVEMITQTEKRFKEAKNLLEAKSLYSSAIKNGGGVGQILSQVGAAIKWNGQDIKDYYISFGEGSAHKVTEYSQTYNGKIRNHDSHTLDCSNTEIYFDDTDGAGKTFYKRRAQTLFANNRDLKKFVVVKSWDVPELEKILGIKVSELKSFKAVVPAVPKASARVGKGVDLTKRGKHTAKMFVFKVNDLSYKSIASDSWEIKEVKTGKGIFIPIDRFHPKLPKINSLAELKATLTALKQIGVNINIPIYGVKNCPEKIDGMIRFDVWVDRKLNRMTEKKRNYELALTFTKNTLFDVSRIDETKLENETMREYVSTYKKAEGIVSDTRNRVPLMKVYRESGLDIRFDKRLIELSKEFDERYPMLKLIDASWRGSSTVIDYIQEREKLLK